MHVVSHGVRHELHVIIASLNRETSFAAASGFALSSLAIGAPLEINRYRLRHTMNGEIAAHLVVVPSPFNFSTLEGHRRKLFSIKEVGAFEVTVTFVVMRIDAFYRHCNVD